jgi:RimJ/RimL family protein N-acetyltransferase
MPESYASAPGSSWDTRWVTAEPIEPVEITAGRYHLRPPRALEADDRLELSRDPDVALWNPYFDTVDWVNGTSASWSILESITERLAGTVSLFMIDQVNASAQVGFRVAPWARGQGAARTSVRAVSGWAFAMLDLHRITLVHAVGNKASCAVAERTGFLLEGTTRESYRYGDGRLHDEHLHALLATDG